MDGLDEINAIHVGHETEHQIPPAVMLERLVRHHRSEIRAADADIDDVLDPFASLALPRTVANAVGELRHLVEDGVDFGHDIFPIHKNLRVFRRPQRDMQHGAVLGDVDFLATEHRLDS